MSTISSASASKIRQDYMNLLITQLQNQNPLDPMDNDQMATQLAQLSQLEQLENMSTVLQDQSSKFDQLLQAEETAQATSLIGKEVAFFPEDSETAALGIVDYVNFVDGQAQLIITSASQIVDGTSRPLDGGFSLGLDAVQAIRSVE